jgi:signal transduction histidine kinase
MKARGHYIVPLKSRNKLVGILFLYTDPDPPWFERNQEILLSMGSLIADAIEQRRGEEQIREKNKELHDLNELKNKFLGIASHDLRNPLYLIRSFSEILIDGSPGTINEKQKGLLEKIFHSSEFMRALLDNLLDISKIESGNIELDKTVQDINVITQNQMELFQLLAKKKQIKLHLEMRAIPPFAFDKNAVIQAIGNFIGNGIKFSPSDTHIYVSTENQDNKALFSVRDEGPGISEEDQKLLFGEFQTLSAKPTGGEKSTGLGLAIVKKLVHLHGGEVGVSSKLVKGSTFFFTLPLD